MFFFVFLAVLAPSWRHLGSIWEALGLDFGWCLGSILEGFWPRFSEVLGFVLEASGDNLGIRLLWKTCAFDPFCWRLVLDGLVGLREAQRIS